MGTLRLVASDGILREMEYTAKGNILPVRHVLVLREKTDSAEEECEAHSWVQDYALYLLDGEGRLAAWYSGAARIYGYQAEEVIGSRHPSSIPATMLRKSSCRRNSTGSQQKATWRPRAGKSRATGRDSGRIR